MIRLMGFKFKRFRKIHLKNIKILNFSFNQVEETYDPSSFIFII